MASLDNFERNELKSPRGLVDCGLKRGSMFEDKIRSGNIKEMDLKISGSDKIRSRRKVGKRVGPIKWLESQVHKTLDQSNSFMLIYNNFLELL